MDLLHFNQQDDSVKLSKVLLALLELHRIAGSKEGVLALIKEPQFWETHSLKTLGLNLYRSFREGQLFNESGHFVTLLSSRSSKLTEFGLSSQISKDYNIDSPFHDPRLFSFQYDILRLEASLNVRLVIYSRTTSGRLFKLRDERCRDSFNYYDSERSPVKPQVYELILALKKSAAKGDRLALFIVQGSLEYDPLTDENAFITRPLYGRLSDRVVYSFEESSRCQVESFHEFLTSILEMLLTPNSEVISSFKSRCLTIQQNHICEQSDRVCFRIDALELIPRIFFPHFPLSISFSGILGEKWIYSSENTRISHIKKLKYLDPERTMLKLSRMKVEQFMRYNEPRGEDETEESYFSRMARPADVIVICFDNKGSMYMANQELGAHIVKNNPIDDRTKLTKGMEREEKENLKIIEDFLKDLKKNLANDKEECHGEEGFSNEKDKKRYKEELENQIEAKGEDFREHCSVCDKVPQMLRGMKAGGYQKLYTSDISPKLLLESLCMNNQHNKRLLSEACSLSCASFDSESMLEPREDDIRFNRNSGMVSKSYSGCKKNYQAMAAPFQDLESADPKVKLSRQIPIFLGASDSKMIEKDGQEPAIFQWSTELRPYPEAAILKMCEEFIGHVLKRQMILFQTKFEVLKTLMDFLQSYHKPILNFYIEEHNITMEDVFPTEVCNLDDESGILTPLEELFYSENLTALQSRMSGVAGLPKYNLEQRLFKKRKKKKKKKGKKRVFLDDDSEAEEGDRFSEGSITSGSEDEDHSSGEDIILEEEFNFEPCESDKKISDPPVEKEDEEMIFYRTLNEERPSTSREERKVCKSLKRKVEKAFKYQKDIKRLWKVNILGKLERSLIKLCQRLCYFCLNMQSYDGPLLHCYFVSILTSGYLFTQNPNRGGWNLKDSVTEEDFQGVFGCNTQSSRPPLSVRLAYYLTGKINRKPRIQKNGLKINRISLSSGCSLLEASLLLSPGNSLAKLSTLTNTQTPKGSFPFTLLTSLNFLDEPKLPTDLKAWASDIGPLAEKASNLESLRSGDEKEFQKALKEQEKIQKELEDKRDRALEEFEKYQCKNVKEYFLRYLKADCTILLEIMQVIRVQFRSILGLDFIELGASTLSSYSFSCVLYQLTKDRRPGFRILNHGLSYALARNAYLGGVMQCSMTRAGKEAPEESYVQLNETFRRWSKKNGFTNLDKNKRLVKRRLQSRRRELQRRQSGSKRLRETEEKEGEEDEPLKKRGRMTSTVNNLYTELAEATMKDEMSTSNSDGGTTDEDFKKIDECGEEPFDFKKRQKRKKIRRRKLLSLNGTQEEEILENQARILSLNFPLRGGVGNVCESKVKRGMDDDSVREDNPTGEEEEIVEEKGNIYFMERDALNDLRARTWSDMSKLSLKPDYANYIDINSLYGNRSPTTLGNQRL